MATGTPLLRMAGISKRFGATTALRQVSLSLHCGEVLALIGENGAGKSTLMKILSGACRPDEGRMELDGRPFAPAGPHAARGAGIGMIYQELNLAPDLSVEDNIMLGREVHVAGILHRGAQRPHVREVLETLGHAELHPATKVGRLSVAARQVVEIARALVHDAKILVFDEPTSSLPQRDVDRLFVNIARLRRSGKAVIYISHFLEEVRQVAQTYAVLRDGQNAGHGTLDNTSDREIVSLMVGRRVSELFPVTPHMPGATIMAAANLSGRRSPQHVSLEVRQGEILGLAGLVGAGRTETLRCLFGLDRLQAGVIRLDQRQLMPHPRRSIAAGMGFLSEDRKGEGLAQQMSIADNMTLSHLGPFSLGGCLALGKRRRAVSEWMKKLSVKGTSVDQTVGMLSGGNQQKVALARVLHQDAQILLLDEPTRGIDVATKSEIYRIMGELAAQGRAIVFVSSYLPELLAICDRIAVMARGRLREVRPVNEWTPESIMACAVASEA